MIEKWIHNLFNEIGLVDVPRQSGDGVYNIELFNNIKLIVKGLEIGYYIQSMIAEVPKERVESLYILIMEANFLGQGTGRAAIGMSSDENFFTLSLFINYEMNYQEFKEKIEEFINYLEFWRMQIKKHNKIKSIL